MIFLPAISHAAVPTVDHKIPIGTCADSSLNGQPVRICHEADGKYEMRAVSASPAKGTRLSAQERKLTPPEEKAVLGNLRHLEKGNIDHLAAIAAEGNSRALAMLKQLAGQGNDLADDALGKLYETGHGVPKNAATAMAWFHKAARQRKMEAVKEQAALQKTADSQQDSTNAGYYLLLGILALFVYWWRSDSDSTKRKKFLEGKINSRREFTPTQTFICVKRGTGIAIDEGRKKVCLVKGSPKDNSANIHVYSYKDILSADIIEAKAVARACIEHARRSPHLTLGVGAFSVKQQQAISNELEHLFKDNPDVHDFFGNAEVEPFFVKNLENIGFLLSFCAFAFQLGQGHLGASPILAFAYAPKFCDCKRISEDEEKRGYKESDCYKVTS